MSNAGAGRYEDFYGMMMNDPDENNALTPLSFSAIAAVCGL